MNLKEIKEMINLMNENGLTELEVEKEGMRIKIKKTASGEIEMMTPRVSNAEYRLEAQPARSAEGAPAEQSPSKSQKIIASPMVGTFYRSASPEAAPFTEIGQVVEVGQVVCIIEAMKLMNEIKAEIRGKITEIAVENAEPVEFGQTLFVLEPL